MSIGSDCDFKSTAFVWHARHDQYVHCAPIRPPPPTTPNNHARKGPRAEQCILLAFCCLPRLPRLRPALCVDPVHCTSTTAPNAIVLHDSMPTSKSNQPNEYALTKYPSSEHAPINEREDLNPDSRASFLPGHRHSNDGRDDDLSNIIHARTESGTGILGRLSSFMSRDPLLSRSVSTQGTGSYGLVPSFNANNEAPVHDGVHGPKEQGRREAKSSASGAENAADASHFSRHRHGSRSSTRDTIGGISNTTESDEAGNSGEETINVDGDGSDENPPDDSP